MPAICGIIYPKQYQSTRHIDSMLKTLEHRGKDDKDLLHYKNVELGTQGTLIAKQSKGHIYALMDGWISNENELDESLKKLGYPLPEKGCYTEKVLYAYDAWGEEFPKRLSGSFAIAIFDPKKQSLFIYRDRLGKKALYWAYYKGHFLFASELKALIKSGIIPQEPAFDGLCSYLYFGYIPQDMTALKNVNKLLPSYFLHFHFSGSLYIHSYWSYSSFLKEKESPLSSSQLDTDFDSLFENSLKNKLQDRDPITLHLSQDAASLYLEKKLKTLKTPDQLRTISASLLKKKQEEQASKNCGFYHLDLQYSPSEILDSLVKISWILDDPVSDIHIFPTWKMMEIAKIHSSCLFSTVGYQQVLASPFQELSIERKSKGKNFLFDQMPLFLKKIILFYGMGWLHPKKMFQAIRESQCKQEQVNHILNQAIFDPKEHSKLAPKLFKCFSPHSFLQKFYRLQRLCSPLESCLYFDVKTLLPDCHLYVYDRFSEYFHMQHHAPFLDLKLVEFLASLPMNKKEANSQSALSLEKIRQKHFKQQAHACLNLLSKKSPIPWNQTPYYKKYVMKLLKGNLVEIGLLSSEWISKCFIENKANKYSFQQFFTLLQLEVWYRLFIQSSPLSSPPNFTLDELMETS